MKRRLYIIFSLLIIFFGIFLRFYNLENNTQFNWDQEFSVSIPAKDLIVNHHFPLIGAKVSAADLYLGPLYTYIVSVFFFLFKLDPVSGAISAGFLSILSLIAGTFLIYKLFGKYTAFFFSQITAASTFIILMDRIPWNVNLLSISSLFVFSGLWIEFSGIKNKGRGWIFWGIGVLIGLNSHFTAILYFPITAILVLLNRRMLNSKICWGPLFTFLAIMPLVIFELRHKLLINSLINFSSDSFIDLSILPDKLLLMVRSLLDIMGKIIFYDGSGWIREFSGILILFLIIYFRKSKFIGSFLTIFAVYALVFVTGLTIYKGQISEYYYTILFPLIIVGISLVMKEISFKNKVIFPLVVLFEIILSINSFSYINLTNANGLKAKENIVSKILEKSEGKEVSLIYDMKLDWSNGYGYLLDYYKVKLTDSYESDVYWISYPKDKFPGKPDFISGDLALGFPETVGKIYSTKTVNIFNNLLSTRIPKEWSVLQCPFIDFDRYILTSDTKTSCGESESYKNAMIIYSLPKCNIWEMNDLKLSKIESGVSLYKVNSPYIDSITENNNFYVTSFERERCIVFQKNHDTLNTIIDINFTNILENLKKL